MKTEWKLAAADFLRCIKSIKFYMILFFCCYFFLDYSVPYRQMAQGMGVGVTGYLYPLFLGEWSYRFFMVLMMVLAMADAPFRSSMDLYTVMRVGKKSWIRGKILYVILYSFFFQALAVLISALVLVPDLALSADWGSAVRSQTFQDNMGLGQTQGIRYIVESFSPYKAMIYSYLLAVLFQIVTGMFILLVNEVAKSYAGTAAALVLACADLLVENLKQFGAGINVPVLSEWLDLSGIYTGEYQMGQRSFGYEGVVLAGIAVFLGVLLWRAVKYEVIQPVE